MTGHHIGAGFKTRPTLLALQGTSLARMGICLRWMGWLAAGWKPTALALTTVATVVAVSALPLFITGSLATLGMLVSRRPRTLAAFTGLATIVMSVLWTWATFGAIGQFVLVALVAVWPIDALVGFAVQPYRTRRLWAEFRRGFPVRYAILAAKSTRIQGVMDGEVQIKPGSRPILDHPALDRKATFDGDTVWCRCSASPGRKHEALREVLGELAASFVHVQRIDLIAADDHQSFGYLAVTFGPPLLSDDTPAATPNRLRAMAYKAPAQLGIAAAVAAATWTAIT